MGFSFCKVSQDLGKKIVVLLNEEGHRLVYIKHVTFNSHVGMSYRHCSLAWPDRFFPYIGWGKKGLVQFQ